MRLFSYVVEHDYGPSPNPSGCYCTLAFCKYRKEPKAPRNVVELAAEGDWVIGTGGKSKLSTRRKGCLVYAMRVTKKLTLRDYFRDSRFAVRAGNEHEHAERTDRFALVSDHFFYFGSSAPALAQLHLDYPIEVPSRGFRNRFPELFVHDFVGWLEQNFTPGVRGQSCVAWPDNESPPAAQIIDLGLPTKPRRKSC